MTALGNDCSMGAASTIRSCSGSLFDDQQQGTVSANIDTGAAISICVGGQRGSLKQTICWI